MNRPELDAQRNLFQVDLDAISVREEQLNNLVQLWAALGGSWDGSDLAKVAPRSRRAEGSR